MPPNPTHPPDPLATDAAPEPRSLPAGRSPLGSPGTLDPARGRRWWVLVVVTLAQALALTNVGILDVATARVQADLSLGVDDLVWVDRAFVLAFGSVLLVGGRLADYVGRRAVLVAGLVGLGVGALVAGAAPDLTTLLTGRLLQGVFAALVVPAALSILTTTFTERTERTWALGVHGAVAGAGAGLWILLSGGFAADVDWRWCLYAQAIVAGVCALGVMVVLAGRREPAGADAREFDLPGAFAGPAGVCLVLYAFAQARDEGWGDGKTWLLLLAGAALLVVFRWTQVLMRDPLLPKRILLDRDRGTALLGLFAGAVSMAAVHGFVPPYLQLALDFSPAEAGWAFLPLLVPLLLTAPIAAGLLVRRYGAKTVVPIGLGLSVVAFALLFRLDPGSTYAWSIAPALVLLGVGSGLVFGPCVSIGTYGIRTADSGAAAGAVTAAYAVGGTLGLSALSRVAVDALEEPDTVRFATEREALVPVLVDSYTTVFFWAGVLMALALVATALLFRPLSRAGEPDSEPGAKRGALTAR